MITGMIIDNMIEIYPVNINTLITTAGKILQEPEYNLDINQLRIIAEHDKDMQCFFPFHVQEAEYGLCVRELRLIDVPAVKQIEHICRSIEIYNPDYLSIHFSSMGRGNSIHDMKVLSALRVLEERRGLPKNHIFFFTSISDLNQKKDFEMETGYQLAIHIDDPKFVVREILVRMMNTTEVMP